MDEVEYAAEKVGVPTQIRKLAVADIQEVAESDAEQHHATVALRASGDGMVTWRVGQWVTAGSYTQGLLGPPVLELEEETMVASHPQALATPDGYLVVGASEKGLCGAVFDADGAPVSPVSLVIPTDNPMWPDLAFLGNELPVVLWSRPGELRTARLGWDLQMYERLPDVKGMGLTVTPTLRAGPQGFVAVWSRDDGDTSAVVSGRMGPLGAPTGFVWEVDRLDTLEENPRPSVAVRDDGGFAVAWRHLHDTPFAESWVRLYNRDDQAVLELSLHDIDPARRPVLASDGKTLAVAWEGLGADGHHVRMRLYDFDDLRPLTGVVTLSEDSDSIHERPYIAVVSSADGGLAGLVSWETQDVNPGTSRGRTVRVRGFVWK